MGWVADSEDLHAKFDHKAMMCTVFEILMRCIARSALVDDQVVKDFEIARPVRHTMHTAVQTVIAISAPQTDRPTSRIVVFAGPIGSGTPGHVRHVELGIDRTKTGACRAVDRNQMHALL